MKVLTGLPSLRNMLFYIHFLMDTQLPATPAVLYTNIAKTWGPSCRPAMKGLV